MYYQHHILRTKNQEPRTKTNDLRVWQSMLISLCSLLLIPCSLISCRGDEIIFPAEYEVLPMESRELSSFAQNEPIGMYLLNEGNMGSNKATIDYLDFSKGIYIRNIYGERNPNVIKELGDVAPYQRISPLRAQSEQLLLHLQNAYSR